MNASDCDRETIYASALDALPGTGDNSLEDGQEDPRIDRWLDEQALMLHTQGRTYREIASLLTISVGGAWKRVQRQQAKLEAVEPGDRAEIRNECLLALRMAISSVSEEAADGEPEARVVLNQLANTILRFWKQEDAQQCLPNRAARKRLAAAAAEDTPPQLPASRPQQPAVCDREQDREQTVNTELQSEAEQEIAREQAAVAQRDFAPAMAAESDPDPHLPASRQPIVTKPRAARFELTAHLVLMLVVNALLYCLAFSSPSVEEANAPDWSVSPTRMVLESCTARHNRIQEADPQMTQISTDSAGVKRISSKSVYLGAICG